MSRLRVRHRQLILACAVGAVVMLIICLTIGVLLFRNFETDYSQETAELEQELADTKKVLQQEMRQIPVVINDHKAGDALAETDIALVNIPAASVPENILNKEDVVGKYTKIALPKNTAITKSMLFENGVTPDDLRNQEFKLIQLPATLGPDQFVDVRIKFPTGEDYIVLSKKKVKDLSNNLISYEMDEQEILMMSSAVVDAYINEATIYALSYVDPYMQDKAIVTYPPKDEVKKLIQSDPNIVKVATEQLESRKRSVLEMNLAAMSEEDRSSGTGSSSEGPPVSSRAAESDGTGYSSQLPPVKDALATDPNAYEEGQQSSSPTVGLSANGEAESPKPVEEAEEAAAAGDEVIYGQTPKSSVQP
ncbi:SAF domain-containing protein [Paenibacillus sp. P96]|uniref:SAF domain-containing protein n=1 Tax=Paenibacillus zeirhizosphaerae TaxID=2987519 RepID=A0ABT9FLM2_9BACL|nr:SAF domain-containing protein [Paenibacillus sp. P96]MDP4095277.1 SAF domain-containing protein [Paenibacillus sp. P96]